MISNLIVGIHDVYLSSNRRLLNTISYVHSYGGGQSIMWGKGIALLFFNLVKVLLYFIRIYLQIYDCISDIILYLCDYEKNGMGVS
jgi:hypothetical protein